MRLSKRQRRGNAAAAAGEAGRQSHLPNTTIAGFPTAHSGEELRTVASAQPVKRAARGGKGGQAGGTPKAKGLEPLQRRRARLPAQGKILRQRRAEGEQNRGNHTSCRLATTSSLHTVSGHGASTRTVAMQPNFLAVLTKRTPLTEVPGKERQGGCEGLDSQTVNGACGVAEMVPAPDRATKRSGIAEAAYKAVPEPRLAGRGWHDRWPPPVVAKRRRLQCSLDAFFLLHVPPPAAGSPAAVGD